MKKIYICLLVTMISWLDGNAQCITNGDFEQGDVGYNFTLRSLGFEVVDCQIDTGTGFSPIFMSTTTNLWTNDGGTLTESPVGGNPVYDPTLLLAVPPINMEVVKPGSGTRAIKLNESTNGAHVATMSQIIEPSGNFVSFDFSMVLELHNISQPDRQPFFSVRLYNAATNEIVNTNEICIKADPNNTLFTSVEIQDRPILYSGWRCGRLEIPDELIGTELRLEFIMTDCGVVLGHFGTVYIDNITCTNECDSPPTGYIILDEQFRSCPTEPFDVCGTFLEPEYSTLDTTSLELTIINSSGVETSVPATPVITGNTFCFTVNPALLSPTPDDFEFRVDASFDSTINTYVFELFDLSANTGPDVSYYPVDITNAYVNNGYLIWDDIAESYELEFVSDSTCCPDSGANNENSYFTTTITDNTINLYIPTGAVASKCFRWRIRTDCGGWSEWCCLAHDEAVSGVNNFGDNEFGNPLECCYPEDLCEPTLFLDNIPGNTVASGTFSFELKQQWIVAENIIANGGEAAYKAGNYVQLDPTFYAQAGSFFIAEIDFCTEQTPCEGEPEPRLKMFSSLESCGHDHTSEQFASAFTVYPNPTNGQVTITGETAAGVFTLIDVTGKELMRIENADGVKQVSIDLSGLSTGVYFLSADGVMIKKVIKN